MFFRLLSFNLDFLVPLGAIDRFIQILKIAELRTWGEHMIKYGALARTDSRARRCSFRLLRSHPVLRSRLWPGSNTYFLHTSVTRGGEYISIMSTPRRMADNKEIFMSRPTAIVTVALSWWIISTIARKSVGPHPRLVIGLSRARGQSSIPLRIGAPRVVDLGCTACGLAAL